MSLSLSVTVAVAVAFLREIDLREMSEPVSGPEAGRRWPCRCRGSRGNRSRSHLDAILTPVCSRLKFCNTPSIIQRIFPIPRRLLAAAQCCLQRCTCGSPGVAAPYFFSLPSLSVPFLISSNSVCSILLLCNHPPSPFAFRTRERGDGRSRYMSAAGPDS